MIIDWTVIGSFATAVAVIIAAAQVKLATRQEKTEFEDALVREYRELIAGLPKEILLEKPVSDAVNHQLFPLFYRYIDLCNEQIFLRERGRIRKGTWREWCRGIRSNLKRSGYREAWEEIKAQTGSFSELRDLENSGFSVDPRSMRWRRLRTRAADDTSEA